MTCQAFTLTFKAVIHHDRESKYQCLKTVQSQLCQTFAFISTKILEICRWKNWFKMYCELDFDKRDIALSLEQLQIISLQIYTGECLQDLWKKWKFWRQSSAASHFPKKWSFQKLCLKACLSLNTLLWCKNYNMLTRVLFRIKTTDNFILFSLYKLKTYPFWFFCCAIWSEAQGEKN